MAKWQIRDVAVKNLNDYAVKTLGKGLQVLAEEKSKDRTINEAMDLIVNHEIDAFSQEFMTAFINNPHVVIIGDYDCDGIGATSIIRNTLKEIDPMASVEVYIPRRITDGYGINVNIIDKIYEKNIDETLPILLTVDNGISAYEAVSHAKEMGFTVFVSDHHPISEGLALPPADMLVDLQVEGDGFKDYCGAGVALNIAHYLLKNYPHEMSDEEVDEFEEMLVSIAVQSTIADVMSLLGPNRVIVEEGLKYLANGHTTTGIKAFMDVLGKQPGIKESDIAFYFGPGWNAPGRLYDDGGTKSFNLMSYNGPYYKALKMAKSVIEDNENRKLLSEEATTKVEEQLEEFGYVNDKFIVAAVEELEEGFCGLIAGKLSEKYKKPVAVFSINGDEAKGSARSYGSLDIKSLLDDESCSILFTRYGGHASAAGITIPTENIDIFRRNINELCKNIEEVEEVQYYDLVLTDLSELTKITDDLKLMEPFGEGNPSPVFLIKGFTPRLSRGAYYSTFEKKPDGIKLFEKGVNAINFDMKPRFMNQKGEVVIPKKMNMLGTISENIFMGNSSWQIRMTDFDPIEYNPGTFNVDTDEKISNHGLAFI